MSYERLWKAKKALEPLLKEACMKGSACWGPKSENNVHSGLNLVFRVGDEMVTISQPDKRLRMQEFRKTTDTQLGQRVRNLLRKEGSVSGAKQIFALSAYTAHCPFGWMEDFDVGITGEVDSRGAGSRELLRKIFDAHEKKHPGCGPANVEIIDPQMVKLGQLSELMALERA